MRAVTRRVGITGLPRVTAPDGGTYAYRCGWCTRRATWRLQRVGDAAVTWACTRDLSDECERWQRDGEHTRLVVTHVVPPECEV